MNGTCIVSGGASLAFAYCSFCSDNVSSDSSCDNRGCIFLDRNEIVVDNDDTCICNVNIYLKDGVNFNKLYIILVKDPSLADKSCLQKYVKIAGWESTWFFKNKVTFSNVSYNGFSKYYSRRYKFSYVAPKSMDYFDFFVLMCLEDDNGQAVVGNPFKARIMRQNCKNMTSSNNVVNNKVFIDESNKKSISTETNIVEQSNSDTLIKEVKVNDTSLPIDRIETNVTNDINNHVTNGDVKVNDTSLPIDRIETNVTTEENNYVTNGDVKVNDTNLPMDRIETNVTTEENNYVTNKDVVDINKENKSKDVVDVDKENMDKGDVDVDKEDASNDVGINNSLLTNEDLTDEKNDKDGDIISSPTMNRQVELNKRDIINDSDVKESVDILAKRNCINNNMGDDIVNNELVNDSSDCKLSRQELISEEKDVVFHNINRLSDGMVPTSNEKEGVDISNVVLNKLSGLVDGKVVTKNGTDEGRSGFTGLHKNTGSVNKKKNKDIVVNDMTNKSGKGCCRGCRAR